MPIATVLVFYRIAHGMIPVEAAQRMTAFPRDTSDLHGVPDDCRRGNPVEYGRNNQ